MDGERYLDLVAYYEACLARHGDSHLGVNWPKKEQVDIRHRVMLELIKTECTEVSLLDFGCGASHLYEYILRRELNHIRYAGLDISEKFIDLCRRKFPDVPYFCLDILAGGGELPEFDYVIMNGVFTVKHTLSFAEMREHFQSMLSAAYAKTKIGLAFNVMSSHVDWERDDLFHLPLDTMAAFVVKTFGRDFVIRNDYGLYEYTTYLYRRSD